jgi:predicted AAA+ superfamily ATPase
MGTESLQNTLKEMILDFQSEDLFLGTRRRLKYEIVPHKAFICIGVRRCGKSTLLHQIIDNVHKTGVPKENVLYLNFFDDRLQELRKGDLGIVLDVYFSLFPRKKGEETIFCIFDELQEVTGWEGFIDRILRTENCEVFISGSSAKMLSKEIATQMRGRSISWELFPFSFCEFMDFHAITADTATTKNRHLRQNAFAAYWESGGFPEVLNVSKKIRTRIHQEYFSAILYRDIIERNDTLHPQAVVDAAFRLLGSVGSLYSINRITDYLKSLGHKVSKDFTGSCLQWFEDAYFLFSTHLFDASAARRNVNPKKIYCIDHAFVRSIVPGILEDRGHLLESLVFVHLRRSTEDIFYYRTERGNEVDFLYTNGNKEKSLIQVCFSLANETTRNREVTSLFEAMRALRIERGTLVTFEERETIRDGAFAIEVVPGHDYFLTNSE